MNGRDQFSILSAMVIFRNKQTKEKKKQTKTKLTKDVLVFEQTIIID